MEKTIHYLIWAKQQLEIDHTNKRCKGMYLMTVQRLMDLPGVWFHHVVDNHFVHEPSKSWKTVRVLLDFDGTCQSVASVEI